MGFKDLLKILFLATIWGPTFLLVKIAVTAYPPVTLTFYRCFFSFVFLLIIALLRKQLSLNALRKHFRHVIVAGLLGNALAFTMCSLGEVYVASSTAGIIEGSVPMFTLLLTKIFIPTRKMTSWQIIGIFLGFIGLLVIFIPSFSIQGSLGEDSWIGVVCLIMMALGFASSFIYTEVKLVKLPAIEVLTVQIFASCVFLFFVSLIVEGKAMLQIPEPKALGATMIMSFNSSIGWVVLYGLVRTVGASLSSIATYLFPIIAIILGIVFLDERPEFFMYIGALIVFASMVLSGGAIDNFLKWRSKRLWQQNLN